MDNLCLVPVMQGFVEKADGGEEPPPVQLDAEMCRDEPIELWLDGDGRLLAAPLGQLAPEQANCVAAVTCRQEQPGKWSWWLVAESARVSLNGLAPLPLASLDAGAILAHGANHWLVTSRWTPTPRPAPPAMASRQCPVCGGELRLAPVVQCPCGRYYHLENPEEPNNSAFLNCYLEGPCGLCKRPPRLESMYLPEPDPTIVGPHGDGTLREP